MDFAFGYKTTIRRRPLLGCVWQPNRSRSVYVSRDKIFISNCTISNNSKPSKLLLNTWLSSKTLPLVITAKKLRRRLKTHNNMRNFEWTSKDQDFPFSSLVQVLVPDKHKPKNLTQILDLGLIPIIDMDNNPETLVLEISRACRDYGVFKVINHGIPKKLCKDVLEVITQFFNLSCEEKANFLSTQQGEDGKIIRYFMRDVVTREKIFMWSEAFYHIWHPVDSGLFIDKLPSNPPSYREIIVAYVKDIAPLITLMLSLISQSLGLDKDYIQKSLGENPLRTAQANYYPPCPNPDLTLGLGDHTDLKMLTILLQDDGITGLQVLKDGEWFGVAPEPGALVVNVADQLQVLSNNKYKSVRHRVVNNETHKRASMALFIGPQKYDIVGPIPELIDANNN